MSQLATQDERYSTNGHRNSDTNETSSAGAWEPGSIAESLPENLKLSVPKATESDLPISQSLQPDTTAEKQATRREVGEAIARRQVLPFPARRMIRHDTFVAEQMWDGVVIGVGKDTFEAKLRDKSSGSKYAEIGEFPIDDIQEDELSLLKEGAVFSLSIGYRITEGRQRSRETALLFRRLPVWSEKTVSDARKKAAEVVKELKKSDST